MAIEHRNIFRQLGTWFASGREDFFTASLAAMLDRTPAFLDSFLSWIPPWKQAFGLVTHDDRNNDRRRPRGGLGRGVFSAHVAVLTDSMETILEQIEKTE